MNENNELNDIILNKNTSTNSNKKIILAVATLGIVLIVVVILMNSLSSNGTDNLPQAVLPPEPQAQVASEQEPLFEDIEVEEESSSDNDLDMIAQKLKQESFEESTQDETVEEVVVVEEIKKVTPKTKPKKYVEKKKVVKKAHPVKTKAVATGSYYIQVGSFSKYEPNSKFLNSITKLGFNYKFHKTNKVNKVLVGPFKTLKEAKNTRRVLRSKVEPGAFLIKL